MFVFFEKALLAMVLIRLVSGSTEILAACLMLHFNEIEKAIAINSSLALIGPLIFIITTTIGLLGIADKISFIKFIWISLGVVFIMYGVLSN